MSNNTDDNGSDSSTEQDVTVDSSSTQDVKEEPSTSEKPLNENPRFQQVIKEKNSYKQKVAELEEMLSSKQEEVLPVKTDTVPDYYDDPEAFAKYIEQRAVTKIKNEQKHETALDQKAKKLIKDQFNTIKDKHGEIDEDAIGEFAMEYNIIDKNTNGYNLIKAHELMRKMDNAKEEGGKEIEDNIRRGQAAKVAKNSGHEGESLPAMPRSDLRKMSLDNLTEYLSNKFSK